MNRVLMIEDNNDDIELAQRMFEQAGLPGRVHVIRNGPDALDFLLGKGTSAEPKEAPNIRLILLDLYLPKVSGLDVLRQIRLNPSLRHIPVVILTVSTKEPDLLQSFTMGVTDYLIKPLNAERFLHIYKKYVAETSS